MTRNDRAWNEYIKKEQDFIELGTFKSTTARGKKEWPKLSASNTNTSQNPITTVTNQPCLPATTIIPTNRVQGVEKRRLNKEICEKALQLAEKSVDQAMQFIRCSMPEKFLPHSSWYGIISCLLQQNYID